VARWKRSIGVNKEGPIAVRGFDATALAKFAIGQPMVNLIPP
jgi:hypothetical protein